MDTTFDARKDYLLNIERMLQEVHDYIQTEGRKDPTLGGVVGRLVRNVGQDLRWLRAMTGNETALAIVAAGGVPSNANPTINNGPKYIMGKEVGADRYPVTKEDLTPSKDEVKIFKQKIEDLYASFPALQDKDVLNILSKPQGETLLRGVAKKAGVADWQTRDSSDIDYAFFANIRFAMKSKAKGEQLNADLDTKLDENEVEQEIAEEEDETPAPATKKAAAKAPATKKAAATKNPLLEDDED